MEKYKALFVLFLFMNVQAIVAQDNTMSSAASRVSIAGYAQIDYNQPLDAEVRKNGVLDVHRLVLLFGYRFNERTQFLTEVEFEHVSELYVEQAYLQHRISPYLNFRGGLLLIPMGIINEYHEPPTYFGVERPHIDNIIAPTTWREIGAGFTGNILPVSIMYQLYLVNGFNGYNGAAQLSGSKGLRSGRQKGANSYISAPNLALKTEYYGIKGLSLGLSGYFGDTQSSLYNGISKDDRQAKLRADSSVVGIAMLGIDARYTTGALHLRGQYYHVGLSNTEQYNRFTAKNGVDNDLGRAMNGYYLEAGYNILSFFPSAKTELIPFLRYEGFNTHASTSGFDPKPVYEKTVITAGLNYYLTKGAVLKIDGQFLKAKNESRYAATLNAGIGILF